MYRSGGVFDTINKKTMLQTSMSSNQLRIARNIVDLGVREMASVLKVSKATISKAELGKTRDFLHKHNAALTDFFYKNHLSFPSSCFVKFVKPLPQFANNPQKITRFQLKSARCLLNISQNELGKAIGCDKGVINRAEGRANEEFAFDKKETSVALIEFFKQHGIDFPDNLSIFFKKYVDKELSR